MDEVINSGGINVSRATVEHVVQTFGPDEIGVTAPHPEWDEVPAVATTLKPSLSESRAAVGNALGKPARPNHLVTVSVMPTTASGKPDRKRLTRLVASRTQERRRRGLFG